MRVRIERPAGAKPIRASGSPSGGSGVFGLAGAVLVIVAFHGLFAGGLWKILRENWIKSPAAIAVTLFHITIGAVGSVWLSRIMPRILKTSFTSGWASATTASFLCTVVTTIWMAWTAFELIPNVEAYTGLKFGYIGLFLAVPAAIYFWQLGRTFSW